MKEKNITVWKHKLDWITEKGGMVLVITHPDYMNFGDEKLRYDQYSYKRYEELLEYIKINYKDKYWHVLPKEMANFMKRITL